MLSKYIFYCIEVGVNLKQGYNGDISEKDAGQIDWTSWTQYEIVFA